MATVRVQVQGNVHVITLDRPERLNAITAELLVDLVAALRSADADPSARAVVLTGAGRAFCAGDDLQEIDEQAADAQRYVELLQDVTREILGCRLPVIAAVHGWAVGGGFEWVLNCDLVVVGEGTRAFLPEMGLGLFVTGGITAILPRLVGPMRARELLLLGEHIDAVRLQEWGIANWVVRDDEVLAYALTVAERLADLSPRSVAELKRVLNLVSAAELDLAMREETAATVASFVDPSTSERVRNRRP